MNDLQIFSSDIIPVYTTSTGEQVVIGRELHERLKIGKDYSTWFKDMCNYGFSVNNEFSPILGKTSEQGGRPAIDHLLKLTMAKHIAMIQRTPIGMAIRDKLIELETNISELSPELRLLINLELKQKQQDKAIQDMHNRIDNICDVVSLNPNAWRDETKHLIVKISQKLGGNEYIPNLTTEIYDLVDLRGGVSLKTRLTNKRRRMMEEGVCKSKRDKLTRVDIIAEDKKLIEIYLAIVKEMAVKYGVTAPSAQTA